MSSRRPIAVLALAAPLLLLSACRRQGFPQYAPNYHEFAYISDGAANTVSVLDLVYLRPDRTLTVGANPTGLAVNPVRNEVYAVNTGSDSVTVINTELNRVEATIGVRHTPYFIAVAPDGKRAYVPDSASNVVSVLDLDTRHEIATAATGEGPGVARISPDNRFLLVTNRAAGSVSVYGINKDDSRHPLTFREAYDGCPGATDAVIRPDDPTDPASGMKAFIACSSGHQVLDIWLAALPGSWREKHDSAAAHDAKLALLDVGNTPVRLVLEPQDGNIFVCNFDSDSISEISSYTSEVQGTYTIGTRPSRAVVSKDGSLLWVSDFGGDSANLYSIADARLVTGIHTGSHPDALAYSNDEHILLVADAGSSDITVIRTQNPAAPTLVTMLPAGAKPNDMVTKAFTTTTK